MSLRIRFLLGLLAGSAAISACVPGEVDPGAGSGDACGSRGLGPCAEGEYCSFPSSASCGEADAPGVCTEQPTACTKEYVPVCGCDGQTYGNACTAGAAGVSVRKQGACADEPDGDFCGGLAGLKCAEGQFCSYAPEAQCGAADQGGTCKDIPTACTAEYAPVCGCDDKTYASACVAASKGVSVVRKGECETAGKFCGGFAGIPCSEGEYCSFPPATRCGSGDQGGTCSKKAEVCAEIYKPVCGCDGKTYGNACSASSAGVSVLHDGEC